MNRREFVRALAGIPLLGLLVRLPNRKVPYHEIDVLNFNGASHRVEDEFRLIFPDDPGYIGVTIGNKGGLNLIMPGDPDYVDCAVRAASPRAFPDLGITKDSESK